MIFDGATCKFCNNLMKNAKERSGIKEYECIRCGYVKITDDAYEDFPNGRQFKGKEHLVSGLFRELTYKKNNYLSLNLDELEDLINVYAPNYMIDRVNKFIYFLYLKSPHGNARIDIKLPIDLSLTYSINKEEFKFIVRHCSTMGYIILSNPAELHSDDIKVSLTVKGWEYVDSLKNMGVNSDKVFVAMSFDDSLDDIYHNGIKLALEDTKFHPINLKVKEHVNNITDVIIAEIKESRFVVADFTQQKGGVYFEAGYALGLGIPVIWTIKKDDLENVHFDAEHYNFITWEKPDELRDKLFNRIRAVIGFGKYEIKNK